MSDSMSNVLKNMFKGYGADITLTIVNIALGQESWIDS